MARPAALTVADTIAKSFLLAAETRGDRPAIREKKFGVCNRPAGGSGCKFQGHRYGLHATGFRPRRRLDRRQRRAGMGVCRYGHPVRRRRFFRNLSDRFRAQLEYLVNDSATRVIFAEDEEQLDKILACRARCPTLQKIVVFDMEGLSGFSDPMVLSLAEFMALGAITSRAASAVG